MGLASLFIMTYVTLTHAPAEDAVILHQYSRNLAETGTISYIPGGVHAEGATDFLWMLYIALGFKLHLSPTVSTAIANIICAFALSYVLLRLARRPSAGSMHLLCWVHWRLCRRRFLLSLDSPYSPSVSRSRRRCSSPKKKKTGQRRSPQSCSASYVRMELSSPSRLSFAGFGGFQGRAPSVPMVYSSCSLG